MVELKDGRLMMFCRTHIDLAFISFSGDQGETWSLDVPMPGIRAALAAPATSALAMSPEYCSPPSPITGTPAGLQASDAS